MTWEDFFLTCFLVGLGFSVLSFFFGMFDLHLSDHSVFSDHAHGHPGHIDHAHADSSHVSPFNLATIMAFLAWFGGAGFLFTHYYGLYILAAFGVAVLAGLIGGSTVFWFLAKVLVANDHSLKPADYEMTGVLATVNSSIREGGTGEIVYSQEGVRRSAAARSEDGKAIAKGEEVLVLRYEKGCAYVSRWGDIASGGGLDPREVAGAPSTKAG